MRRAGSRNYASVRAADHKYSGRTVKGKFRRKIPVAMIFRHENYNLSGGGTRETFYFGVEIQILGISIFSLKNNVFCSGNMTLMKERERVWWKLVHKKRKFSSTKSYFSAPPRELQNFISAEISREKLFLSACTSIQRCTRCMCKSHGKSKASENSSSRAIPASAKLMFRIGWWLRH